jgi:hypothetical protein
MEPNDLKSLPPEDNHLEAWLQANAALPLLPEDGFPQRVLAALPPPVARHRLSGRWLASLGGAFVGTIIAALPLFSGAERGSLGAGLLHGIELLAQPAVGLAVLTTIISLACAFWRDLRRFLPL